MRQRNWDLKRSTALELAKELGSFQESVLNVHAAWQGRKGARAEDMARANERCVAVFEAHTKRTADLWRVKMVAELFFDDTILREVHLLEKAARQIVILTNPPGASLEDFSKAIAAMAEACKKVLVLVREDLLKP